MATNKRLRVAKIIQGLYDLYPEPETALIHETPLQLLVATILSAQCTDARVNKVTPHLFEKYPDARSLAKAPVEMIETLVKSTNFYKSKAKNIKTACQMIVEKHGGEVPQTMADLIALPGVGRKTANVVLGNAFDVPGIVVDTHVGRLSRRLGLTKSEDPVDVESDLEKVIPKDEWVHFSHLLILHGRAICVARKPKCGDCAIFKLCPKIGV